VETPVDDGVLFTPESDDVIVCTFTNEFTPAGAVVEQASPTPTATTPPAAVAGVAASPTPTATTPPVAVVEGVAVTPTPTTEAVVSGVQPPPTLAPTEVSEVAVSGLPPTGTGGGDGGTTPWLLIASVAALATAAGASLLWARARK
jgi:hypothetical protein